MSQILRDGKEAACQSAVRRITASFLFAGSLPRADTELLPREELSFPEDALKELCLGVASEAETRWSQGSGSSMMPSSSTDFTFKCPNTQKNQKE